MATIIIQGIEVPRDTSLWLVVKPDGTVHKIKSGEKYGPSQQPGRATVFHRQHPDLIKRPNLSLTPDYKDVRNGLKRVLKETRRDGRVIAGLPIELLEQTVVALDELRSLLRYVKNADVIVPSEETTTYAPSTASEDRPSLPTFEFEIGSKVIFQSDHMHRRNRACYPPVGTIGTIVGLPYHSECAIIQWPDGTTSDHDKWACSLSDTTKINEDNT